MCFYYLMYSGKEVDHENTKYTLSIHTQNDTESVYKEKRKKDKPTTRDSKKGDVKTKIQYLFTQCIKTYIALCVPLGSSTCKWIGYCSECEILCFCECVCVFWILCILQHLHGISSFRRFSKPTFVGTLVCA